MSEKIAESASPTQSDNRNNSSGSVLLLPVFSVSDPPAGSSSHAVGQRSINEAVESNGNDKVEREGREERNEDTGTYSIDLSGPANSPPNSPRARDGADEKDAHAAMTFAAASPISISSRLKTLVNAGRAKLGAAAASLHDTHRKHKNDNSNSSSRRRRRRKVEGTKSPARHKSKKQLQKKYTKKIHAYAVPPNSYYAPSAYLSSEEEGEEDGSVGEGEESRDLCRDGDNMGESGRGSLLPRLLPHPSQQGNRAVPHRHNSAGSNPLSEDSSQTCTWPVQNQRQQERRRGAVAQRTIHRRPPRRLAGRLIEQQRYALPPCPPYRIPLYDQACFKYIFSNLFKGGRRRWKLEVMQVLFLCQMFILAIVNLIMTVVNVFFNVPMGEILPWAKNLTIIVFSLEFAVVGLLFLFMLVLLVHAIVVNEQGRASDLRRWKAAKEAEKQAKRGNCVQEGSTIDNQSSGVKNEKVKSGCTSVKGSFSFSSSAPISNGKRVDSDPFAQTLTPHVHRRKNGLVIGTTELAQDFATLITLIGTFSALRIIGLASPSFAFRRILPVFQNAATMRDAVKGVAFVVLWLMACLLAFIIIIAKVTQISFAFTASITEWTIVNYVQLIGLLFNLARVDDSYYKETSVLLDAIHQHYSDPGEVRAYSPNWAVPADTLAVGAKNGVELEYDQLLAAARLAAGGTVGGENGGAAATADGKPHSVQVPCRKSANEGKVEVHDDVVDTLTPSLSSPPPPPAAPVVYAEIPVSPRTSALLVAAEQQMNRSIRDSAANRSRRASFSSVALIHGKGWEGGQVKKEREDGCRDGRERNGCDGSSGDAIPSQRGKETRPPKSQRRDDNKGGTHHAADAARLARRERRRRGWKEEVAAQAQLTDSLSLLTRIMKALHIPPFMYFTYFDVIYDYHFSAYQQQEKEQSSKTKKKKAKNANARSKAPVEEGRTAEQEQEQHSEGDDDDDGPPQLPARTHVYNFFNYLSFIFEIDNVQLRRYLQMVHSPLPFYRTGRDSFMAAFVERDVVCMDMALWCNDPTLKANQRYAMANPGQFNIAYVCEDRRDVWDPYYAEWAQMQEVRNAVEMAKNVMEGVVDIADNDT